MCVIDFEYGCLCLPVSSSLRFLAFEIHANVAPLRQERKE
jgi:hypothetical protein